MARTGTGRAPAPGDFQTVDTLRESLAAGGIELARWGTGQAKTVENLWEELVRGEIRLQADPLCRVLAGVVQVIIRRDDGRILIEEEQRLADGRRRRRHIPPAEKMLHGESYAEAALRCLEEELHIPPEAVTLLPFSHRMRRERRASWSYPGLPSLYTIHQVQVRVADLPRVERFTTREAASPAESIVREHVWVWQEPPPDLFWR